MKRFIRTKEGNIYQRFFKDKSIRGVGGGGCCDKNLNPIGETIIKESDTIEELCDEFVVIHKELNGNKTTHKSYGFAKMEYDVGNDVYGAIWTDKGLIYVAKINEKGELELL